MDIKGKNIIVTGGSLGIGKETALNLIEKGANVLVTGRSIERLKTISGVIHAVIADVKDGLEFPESDNR